MIHISYQVEKWTSSWRVDETYVRAGGKWKYLFRAIDKQGRTVDFLLTHRRNATAARRFLAKPIGVGQNRPGVECRRAREYGF